MGVNEYNNYTIRYLLFKLLYNQRLFLWCIVIMLIMLKQKMKDFSLAQFPATFN